MSSHGEVAAGREGLEATERAERLWWVFANRRGRRQAKYIADQRLQALHPDADNGIEVHMVRLCRAKMIYQELLERASTGANADRDISAIYALLEPLKRTSMQSWCLMASACLNFSTGSMSTAPGLLPTTRSSQDVAANSALEGTRGTSTDNAQGTECPAAAPGTAAASQPQLSAEHTASGTAARPHATAVAANHHSPHLEAAAEMYQKFKDEFGNRGKEIVVSQVPVLPCT